MPRLLRNILLGECALALLAGGLAVALWFPLVRDLLRLAYVPVSSDEMIWPREPSEVVVVPTAFRVEADFYAGRQKPLVVFVHGSRPEGRRSPSSRLMIDVLVQRGFPVLALDLRGFGSSEDPATPWTQVGFDDDVRAAARLAEERGWARSGEIIYFGHSLGAGVVLRAAALAPRPLAVVASGAPATRTYFEQGEALRFTRQRFASMGIEPDPHTFALLQRYLAAMDPTVALMSEGLPRALLIYGEHDRALPHVRWGLPAAAERLSLQVVPRVGHGLGRRELPFGWLSHHAPTTDGWATELEAWLTRHSSLGPRGSANAP